jgi:O-antigen ligase
MTFKCQNFRTIYLAFLGILLLSMPWPISLSTWATGLFSILILFKNKVSNSKQSFKPYLILSISFIFDFINFSINTNQESNWNTIALSLPFLLIPIVFTKITLSLEDKKISLICFAIGVTIALFSCLVIALVKYQEEFYLFLNGYDPVTSLIGMHPSYLSLFVSFSALIVFHFLISETTRHSSYGRILSFLWFFILLLGVFYIRSRVGIVAFIVTFMLGIVFSKKNKKAIYILSFIGLLALGYVAIVKTNFHKGRFYLSQVVSAIDQKKNEWNGSIAVFKDNILFGASKAKAQTELNKEYLRLSYSTGYENSYNSHNQYLSTLIQGGIIGFILIFAPLVILFLDGIKNGNFITQTFSMLILVSFMTESMLLRHKGVIFYTVFICLLWPQEKKQNNSE